MTRLPADEAQLQRMLTQGLLDESHTLELKRELPPGKAANKELAKDLAQFTPDSGAHGLHRTLTESPGDERRREADRPPGPVTKSHRGPDRSADPAGMELPMGCLR